MNRQTTKNKSNIVILPADDYDMSEERHIDITPFVDEAGNFSMPDFMEVQGFDYLSPSDLQVIANKCMEIRKKFNENL